MAMQDGAKLIIRDRQHGETHTLVIDIEAEYNKLVARGLLRKRRADVELPDSQPEAP